MSAPTTISAQELQVLLDAGAQVSLLDVREKITSDAGHIVGSSNVPRRLLEDRLAELVPLRSTPVVVVDHDGRLGDAAASDLSAVGYEDVRSLVGGYQGWASEGRPVSQGHSVPSKDFGELVQELEQVPTVTARELRRWLDEGRDVRIFDVRTPDEHRRETLPGSRLVPGFELPLHLEEGGADTTVVVHCSGRTRSIIGAATLRYSGHARVVALEDGTMGWKLAGLDLDHGSEPEGTETGPGSDRLHRRWRALAASVGVTTLPPVRVHELLQAAGRTVGTVYLFDVRSEAEHVTDHAAGSVGAPGGQLVQLTDAYVGVHGATIVLMCDDETRSSIAAYWLRRLGKARVVVSQGGLPAWEAAGLPLARGRQRTVLGWDDALDVPAIDAADLAEELAGGDPPAVIHVGASDGYEQGHLAEARWVSPTWLEPRLEEVAPDRSSRIVVTCRTGRRARLTARKIQRAGWQDVVVLDGGVTAWQRDGGPVEEGRPEDVEPDDVFVHPIHRGERAMREYLEWERALGRRYAVPGTPGDGGDGDPGDR